MFNLTIPLIEAASDHHAWSVQIDQCGPHQYQYILVEHLEKANIAHLCGGLMFPEPFIALRFAIADMKKERRLQLLF